MYFDEPQCPNCRDGAQNFHYYAGGEFIFDVDRARRLIDDGREPIELDETTMLENIESSELDECHIAHVDPTVPGILAHIWYRDESGMYVHDRLLIDGHHRAARCQREGRPFAVYVLDETESRAILRKCPKVAEPAGV
ncbi:MAG: hypothetical protein K1X57_20935 [Gemmataceae bacterium]|nr:hypothetical protein [Gemmataceae bacterium]